LQTVGNKAKTHRTFKPIWFLPAQKANTEKNQKSLNHAAADLKLHKKTAIGLVILI